MTHYRIIGLARAWHTWREQGKAKERTDTIDIDVTMITDLGERWAVRHALYVALNDGGYEHGQWEAPPAVREGSGNGQNA